MPVPSERFSQLRWLYNISSVLAVVGSVVVMGLALLKHGSSPNVWLFVVGAFALFITVMLMIVVPLMLKMEVTFARQLGELRDLRQAIAEQSGDLHAIAENTRISDAAKSLAHREQELDAIRNALRADLQQQKWDAAMLLIDEVEHRFGFKEEADTFREELDDARRDAIQSKLGEAIQVVEIHFKDHDWDRAQVEIDRLFNALPGDAKVRSLQDRMKFLREQHKQELKLAWDEAVRRSDTDRAIDVLRELDQYLSPAEAHALQASARDVFKTKLVQFGVQFRFAVNEKRWQDALNIGRELIRDFPNSRMSAEVREALDALRDRAKQATEATATQTTEA